MFWKCCHWQDMRMWELSSRSNYILDHIATGEYLMRGTNTNIQIHSWRFNFVLFRRVQDEKRNMRRSHLLLATVVLFVFCWLPLNILNLGEDLNMPLKSWRWEKIISEKTKFSFSFRFYYFSFFCFHLISMSSSICNMLLYGWLNENIASHSHILSHIKVKILNILHQKNQLTRIKYRQTSEKMSSCNFRFVVQSI